MPRRPRKFQHETVIETPDLIEGEAALSVAVIKQALKDLRSPVDFVRTEAVTFWQNAESVRFWEDVIGVSGVLQQEARRLLGEA